MSDLVTRLRRNTRSRLAIEAAERIEELEAAVCELWTRADTSDLDAEMALFVGGVVADEMQTVEDRNDG